MNILVDIGHPGHVHLFRNAIKIWMEREHQVVIATRERDIVTDLLNAYNLSYTVASEAKKGFVGLLFELVEHDWKVFQLVLKYQSDLLLGTSVAASHVSKITKAKSIIFNEDDADVANALAWLSYPFADTIVTPNCLRDKLTSKYVTYNSYHELAYLHPNHFRPDPTVLTELGVQPQETFFILRLVALKAYHDVGQSGMSYDTRHRLVELLSQKGKLFITVEGNLPDEFKPYQIRIPPHRIHHALSYATMLVSDSQTMTVEAAVLGIPAIRCNTFVGRCSVIEELEHQYGLTHGFLPQDADRMFSKITELLNNEQLLDIWQQRRRQMLSEKIDLAAWMVDFVENYPQSFHEHQGKK